MSETDFEMAILGADETLASADTRLVDVVDTLLECGVVLRGELWLTVAGIDLVFLGLDVVVANPDTMAAQRQPGAVTS